MFSARSGVRLSALGLVALEEGRVFILDRQTPIPKRAVGVGDAQAFTSGFNVVEFDNVKFSI
jgi:hypothetical protein